MPELHLELRDVFGLVFIRRFGNPCDITHIELASFSLQIEAQIIVYLTTKATAREARARG